MSAELFFIFTLALKMAVTAGFVVCASIITERAGPVIGALVSTLPISAGPAYVFLSLDHDAAFIASGALASIGINAATGVFAIVYVILAQRHGILVSLGAALGIWTVLAVIITQWEFSLLTALAANVIVYLVAIPLGYRYRDVKMPLILRRWFDVPLRAAMVATLIATVVIIGARVGPVLTGVVATVPIVLTSLILILQPRIGGPATAAVIAYTMWGLIGFGSAVVALHLTVERIGSPAALVLALAVAVGWNLAIWASRRRRLLAQKKTTPRRLRP